MSKNIDSADSEGNNKLAKSYWLDSMSPMK